MLNFKENIILAPYTTFKIGGAAKYFIEANETGEIPEICIWAKNKNIPILILGGGSNVLISDKGFNGLVIKIKNSKFEINDSGINCEAGVPLAKMVLEAAENGFIGLEWAIGIPGTVGGAVVGNAGAFGKSMSDNLEEVVFLENSADKTCVFKKNDCNFSYRNSFFSSKGGSASGGKHNSNLIILSATLNLKKGNVEEIKKTMKDSMAQRSKSNPGGFSAGCFFKNIGWENIGDKNEIIKKFPELKQFEDKPKVSAGFLIEQIGLKGKSLGNAEVSSKHANFIINKGNASAEEIINLVNLIKEKVRERYGFNLEDEVVVV